MSTAAPSRWTLAALGACVPLGWLVHDGAVFLTRGILPDTFVLRAPLLVLLAAALLGWLARRRAFVLALLALSAAAAALPWVAGDALSPIGAWRVRALFLLALGFASARWIGERRPGRLRVALALGLAACVVTAELRGAGRAVEWPLVGVVAAVAAAGWLRSDRWRRGTTGLALLVALWAYGGFVRDSLAPRRPALGPPPATAPAGAPNLLLAVLDTVRADHLTPYGYERETTPELDAWVRAHFTVYANARSTGSWTLPSHASLFTGVYPAQHGAVFSGEHGRAMGTERPTLAQRLRARGYRTAGVVANTTYLRARSFGMERGFEHYDDRLAGKLGAYLPLAQLMGAPLRTGHLGYRDARAITNSAIRWLDRRGAGPFFLALNYMDVHEPNIPLFDRAFSDARALDPLDPPASLQVLNYDRELLFLDRHVARLLTALEQRDLFDDTVVIVTSDHGEALGDHGQLHHGWVLYEALVHVPLYVKPAGGRTAERVSDDVTSADVFHLALELLGIPSVPEPALEGIVAELYVHPAELADDSADLLAWMEGTRKVIVSSSGAVEAYDLRRDPDERAPLSLAPGEIEAALRRARAWWAEHPIGVDPARAVPRTEDELERLRALGY